MKKTVRILCYVLLCALTLPKSYVFAFSEQRKFIGQEYDAGTGLNYLNARYYDAQRGQFISQDPMFWNPTPELLADPQQLNSYSYARNNPLIYSDPTGELTAYFPGTGENPESAKNGNFVKDVKSTFSNLGSGENFWLPSKTIKDNSNSRLGAAQELNQYLSSYKFSEGETFNVVGYSHGGNAANIFSQFSDHKIDNLVTIGTPVRYDYLPSYKNIKNHYNAYSNLDFVQSAGGTMPTSALAGGIAGGLGGSLFGPIGTSLGSAVGFVAGFKLGWGEVGPALRKYADATNINVTLQTKFGPISSHKHLPSSSVWSKIDKVINRK